MTRSRQASLLSIAILVALIVALSATGVVAQPPGEPADSHPVRTVLLEGDSLGKPQRDLEGRGGEGAVDPPATAEITIYKSANPDDGTDFTFRSGMGAFTLDDADPDDGDKFGDSIYFKEAPTERVSFMENMNTFWHLSSIVCALNPGSIVDAIWDGDLVVGVAITAAPGDHVACTFSNTRASTTFAYLPIVSKGLAN